MQTVDGNDLQSVCDRFDVPLNQIKKGRIISQQFRMVNVPESGCPDSSIFRRMPKPELGWGVDHSPVPVAEKRDHVSLDESPQAGDACFVGQRQTEKRHCPYNVANVALKWVFNSPQFGACCVSTPPASVNLSRVLTTLQKRETYMPPEY
jgi:hypothetical protein